MPFSKCRNVVDRVSSVVDGELGPVARVRFFAHLAMCEHCTRYFEQFKAVREAAGTVGPDDLPEDFGHVMDAVFAAIERGPDPEKG